MRRPPRRTRRSGFTLVEILVVIVIIGILSALLLPAISGALKTAKDAAVTADINSLANALASFKEKYGDYPPSRIMLSENGRYDVDGTGPAGAMILSANGPSGRDITYAQLAQKSISYLRKFWPRVVISTTGNVWTANTQFYDFNGNGEFITASPGTDDNDTDNSDGFYGTILEGDECLAFFLGGIPLNTGGTGAPAQWSMSGFGKLPTNPFSNNLNSSTAFMYNGNRTPPIFEFKNERLVDIVNTRFPKGNGFPSYTDSLGTGKPFAYFSGWSGGYDPNDVNVAEADASSVSPILRVFRVSFSVRGSTSATTNQLAASAPPNAYSSSPPNGLTTTQWEKGQTFQIISAGRDGEYGLGGLYTPTSKSQKLPLDADSPATGVDNLNLNTTDIEIRQSERDNLTNFASGPLE